MAGRGRGATRWLGDGLPSRDVSAVAYDRRSGRAWVGTFDGGLAFRDDDGWHRVGAEELDPQINAVAIGDDGVAWVGTARGLTRIEGDSVQTFGRKAGIPHEHVLSVLPRRDGSVVVGTARGFVTVENGKVVRPKRGAEKWGGVGGGGGRRRHALAWDDGWAHRVADVWNLDAALDAGRNAAGQLGHGRRAR